MSNLPYHKSLDGIRGIAVLMVIMIHSRLLPFGWIGVQIFFVLSGFLITSILVAQKDQPFADYIKRFYWRRGLRIWPLYFFYLFVCLVAYLLTGTPETWPKAWPWLTTFTYNIARISPGFLDSGFFGHFWTLSVEEQFYFVWPFIVFFLPLQSFRRVVILVIVAGPVMRYFTAEFFSHYSTPYAIHRAVHNFPTSHIDAFAAGALLVVLPERIRAQLAERSGLVFLTVLSVTLLFGAVQTFLLWSNGLPPQWLAFGYGRMENFRQDIWGYTTLNLTSAALVMCAIHNRTASRWLSIRPLAFVGMISYGLYLWHLPLLMLSERLWLADHHSISGLTRFATYVLATFAVASLSYFGFERRFLKMKNFSFGQPSKPKVAPETVSAP